jgi:hypothetical protein
LDVLNVELDGWEFSAFDSNVGIGEIVFLIAVPAILFYDIGEEIMHLAGDFDVDVAAECKDIQVEVFFRLHFANDVGFAWNLDAYLRQ